MTVIIGSGSANTQGINILYQNRFKDGTVTWSSQTSSGQGINTLDPQTWNFWQPSSVPAHQTLDYGSAVSCDGACIAAHDAHLYGATLSVQSSTDNVTWTTRGTNSPATGDTIFFLFPAVSARYWRIAITGATCRVAVIMIGTRLTFPNSPLSGHTPFHHSWESEMLTNVSDGGQFLGDRVLKTGSKFSVNAGSVERDFVENNSMFAVFERHFNNGGSFAYCGSPQYTPKDCAYCKRDSEPMSVSWIEGDILADVSFSVKGFVHG